MWESGIPAGGSDRPISPGSQWAHRYRMSVPSPAQSVTTVQHHWPQLFFSNYSGNSNFMSSITRCRSARNASTSSTFKICSPWVIASGSGCKTDNCWLQ